MSSLYSEAELPGLSAGEIRLKGGRVSGLWKVSRGEGDTVQYSTQYSQYSTLYSTQGDLMTLSQEDRLSSSALTSRCSSHSPCC